MNKVHTPQEMTPDYRRTVTQMLQSQGYRELMAANILGHAMKFVPSLSFKMTISHHIEEELEHYAEVDRLYQDVTSGANLLEDVDSRLSRVPYPENWFELAMVQFLYDRAGEFHLKEYRDCSYEPYAKIVGKILMEEEGHEGFGEEVLKDFCHYPSNRAEAQRLFNKWLPIAMLSFGRPDTPGNDFAIQAGLKTRDSGEVMQDFLNDIKPAMRECGLKFPRPEEMDLVLPDNVDLTL